MLAIELESENRKRAIDGLPPLKFNEADAQNAPPSSPQSSTPAPSTTTPQAPPSTSPSSASPVLVPSSTQPLPVTRNQSRRSSGRRESSGQTSIDQIGESLEARDAARYSQEAANNRAQAAQARARGEDDAAAQYEAAARVADENARKVGQRRGRSSTQPAPKKGDPLGILD